MTVCLSVCLPVSPLAHLKHVQTSRNFLYVLNVAGFVDDVMFS